jgi:hypothetical protein
MPIAEIAAGIILALCLVAFWRVLLPFAGAVLVLAVALSYGHAITSRQGRMPDAAPGAAAGAAEPAVRHDVAGAPAGPASTRPAAGMN